MAIVTPTETMAPPKTVAESGITYSPAYNDFMQKLSDFHEQRGTHLEREPRVGSRTVDLLQLYNSVVSRGGYDKVSDQKLAWRKVGEDFNIGTNNIGALAFALKTTYYKNLAAYEIKHVHGKEPPPKEILEETTAKGAGLLTRTLENYRPSARRETGLGNDNSEASGDDGTPARERNASEETPGSGGRVTRGLRQAPPQRILFQPDTQPSRQTRNISATSHASSPHHSQSQTQSQQQAPRGASTSFNPSSNMENQSQAVANYEPRPQMPLTLRPVITPGNNPSEFARRKKLLRDSALAADGRLPPAKRDMVLPGKGFSGPNIYVRCLCALKSGIQSEQAYALHHLVKISMERGDKYRFEGFPGLAEALTEKVLEISSLFFKVDWEIAYTEDEGMLNNNTLNGIDGTPDVLQRISNLVKLDFDDNIQTAEFSDAMLQVNEAALTLRNMVMLEENALYVADLVPLRDFLSIALNLPDVDTVVELRHYALDIAEQITKYLHLDENDPLYVSLVAQLRSTDRGAILTALRAISRISMNLEENNLLKGVPKDIIQNIIDWTLLYDDDLVSSCLDFLYQYTAVVDNVDFLISELQVEPLVNQLVRLLMHGAKAYESKLPLGRDHRIPPPADIAPLPRELLSDLLKLEEPDRSSQWLRCLFEEDPEAHITQIALWQAYQACFTPTVAETGVQLLPAADFIKNVSTTFAEKAAAQVQAGPVQKFIIKGIRRRLVPIDLKGEEYSKCLWGSPSGATCGHFFMAREAMYKHILEEHLSVTKLLDGNFDNAEGRYTCNWLHCHRFTYANPATKALQIAQHIKVHLPTRPLPDSTSIDYSGPPPAKKHKPSYIIPAPKQIFKFQNTALDERNDAAGIPLSAVLVLRNLARNLPKTDAEEVAAAMKEGEREGEGEANANANGATWVERLFKPVEPRLFEVMVLNKSLIMYMTDLLDTIKKA